MVYVSGVICVITQSGTSTEKMEWHDTTRLEYAEVEKAHKAFPDRRPVNLNDPYFIPVVAGSGELVGVVANNFVNQVLQAIPLAKKSGDMHMDFNAAGLIPIVNDDYDTLAGIRDEFVNQVLQAVPSSKKMS